MTYTIISVIVFILVTTERRTRLSSQNNNNGDNKMYRVSVASNTLRQPLIDNSDSNNYTSSTVNGNGNARGGVETGRHDSYTGSYVGTHLQQNKSSSSRGYVRDFVVRSLLSVLFHCCIVEVDVNLMNELKE